MPSDEGRRREDHARTVATVDVQKVGAPKPRFLHGQFIEYLDPCIYDGCGQRCRKPPEVVLEEDPVGRAMDELDASGHSVTLYRFTR